MWNHNAGSESSNPAARPQRKDFLQSLLLYLLRIEIDVSQTRETLTDASFHKRYGAGVKSDHLCGESMGRLTEEIALRVKYKRIMFLDIQKGTEFQLLPNYF